MLGVPRLPKLRAACHSGCMKDPTPEILHGMKGLQGLPFSWEPMFRASSRNPEGPPPRAVAACGPRSDAGIPAAGTPRETWATWLAGRAYFSALATWERGLKLTEPMASRDSRAATILKADFSFVLCPLSRALERSAVMLYPTTLADSRSRQVP